LISCEIKVLYEKSHEKNVGKVPTRAECNSTIFKRIQNPHFVHYFKVVVTLRLIQAK